MPTMSWALLAALAAVAAAGVFVFTAMPSGPPTISGAPGADVVLPASAISEKELVRAQPVGAARIGNCRRVLVFAYVAVSGG